MACFTCAQGKVAADPEKAVGPGRCRQAEVVFGGRPGDQVDHPVEGIGTEGARCRPGKELHPRDAFRIYRKIQVMMAGLGITDVDAIEQNEGLVKGASADGDVGLRPQGSPLPDVGRRENPQQFGNTLGRNPLYFHTGERRHHPGDLLRPHRRPPRRHHHLLQVYLPHPEGVGRRLRPYSSRNNHNGIHHRENSNPDLPPQRPEYRISLAHPSAEGKERPLLTGYLHHVSQFPDFSSNSMYSFSLPFHS